MSDTESNAAPMRLRAEPPRVTRLSRKMLAGVGAAALLGIGGALIYALQTRDAGPGGEELYSTENRPTADGLSGLPRDYTGPILGPALPGDLGRPILDAQNRGQPVAPPVMATPAVDPEEQRRLAEEEAARQSCLFPDRAGNRDRYRRRKPKPRRSWSLRVGRRDGHAGSARGIPQRPGRPAHCRVRSRYAAGIALHSSGWGCHTGRSHHRHPLRSAGPDHGPGDGKRL